MAKQTFAQRATAIQKKYPRASYDRYEKEALDQELKSLAKEQEVFKQEQGMESPQGGVQEMKYGGRIKYFNAGNLKNNDGPRIAQQDMEYLDSPKFNPIGVKTPTPGLTIKKGLDLQKLYPNMAKTKMDKMKPYEANKITPSLNYKSKPVSDAVIAKSVAQSSATTKEVKKTAEIKNKTTDTKGALEYSDVKADYKPLAIATATGILGNLALEKRNKERMKETYNVTPYSPKTVDLSEERKGIESARSRASSTLQNRIKSSARTRGELLENQGVGQAELESGYNDAMRKSYSNEQAMNTQIQNQASQYNSQLYSNLAAARHADRRGLQGEQDAYRSGALGIVGDAAKQYSTLKMSADDMNAIGDHYKIAINPKTGKRERVYFNKETGERIKD